MWIASDDAEPRCWHGLANRRPDVAAEVFHRIHIRFPVHRTEKHHDRVRRIDTGGVPILRHVHAGRCHAEPIGGSHRQHGVAIAIRYGDHMRKAAHRRTFVPIHLPRLDGEGGPLERIRFVRGLPAPQNRFDVVLEEHARRARPPGEIQRRGQKIAYRHVEAIGVEPLLQEGPDAGRRELGNRIRRRRHEMPGVVPPAVFGHAGMDGLAAGETIAYRPFV